MCPESYSAFEGALATVCEAIDGVMAVRPIGTPKEKSGSADSRAFVVIRPPGHHCSEVSGKLWRVFELRIQLFGRVNLWALDSSIMSQ